MASTEAPTTSVKPVKPKKVVMSTGRGGGGNFREVKTKKYVTETKDALSASTNKRMLEIELPRNKAAYSGRGGAGNKWDHVLEDGVFSRVIQYELGKVKANQGERDEKRRSTARSRTYSTSKANKSTSLVSDDVSIAPSQSPLSMRRSWVSHSTVDASTHPTGPSDIRKSLRQTLLAPLRINFTRRPHSISKSIRDDTSSFSACSSGDAHYNLPIIEGPVSPIEAPTSPISHTSDETYSAITPSTPDMLSELAGRPDPEHRFLGNAHHRASRLAPPMPSPMSPLPPIPIVMINEGRSSLSAPAPALSIHSPPNDLRSKIAAIPLKSLQANPTSAQLQQSPYSHSSSASLSQEMLQVPRLRSETVTDLRERAPNRRFYNAAVAARSMGHLQASFDSREASFYDGSDVDRVDPFLAELGHGVGDKSIESLLPWIDAPNSRSASSSSLSIPSLNDSRPELVAA